MPEVFQSQIKGIKEIKNGYESRINAIKENIERNEKEIIENKNYSDCLIEFMDESLKDKEGQLKNNQYQYKTINSGGMWNVVARQTTFQRPPQAQNAAVMCSTLQRSFQSPGTGWENAHTSHAWNSQANWLSEEGEAELGNPSSDNNARTTLESASNSQVYGQSLQNIHDMLQQLKSVYVKETNNLGEYYNDAHAKLTWLKEKKDTPEGTFGMKRLYGSYRKAVLHLKKVHEELCKQHKKVSDALEWLQKLPGNLDKAPTKRAALNILLDNASVIPMSHDINNFSIKQYFSSEENKATHIGFPLLHYQGELLQLSENTNRCVIV